MDKTASERPPLRPSVPRLHLSSFASEIPQPFDLESLQLTTCRSDVEDFVLPTSFRTSRGRNESGEKIPMQLEKLNGLIENMMENLKETEESKSVEDFRFPSPDFTCHLSSLDSRPQLDLERALMSLEDACASEWRHREEKLDLQRQLSNAEAQLSFVLSLPPLASHPEISTAIQSKLTDLLTTAEGLGLTVSKLKTDTSNMLEAVVANELRSLKKHIENLSGMKLNSLSGNWEVEIPAFCRNLVQVYSGMVQQKQKEGTEAFRDLMKVTCSAEDLQGVVHRVCEILEDFEESGTRKEFGIQLGRLGVTVEVEGEEEEENRCLPQEMGQALMEQIACRAEASLTERAPSPHPQQPSLTSLSYIHQLEDRILDLQAALRRKESEYLPPDAPGLSSDLETKLEELMYKLALANKQIDRLKQGKYSPEEEKMGQNFKLIAAELVLREEGVKDGTTKLAVERERLRLQVREFEDERDRMVAEHRSAMEELEAAFEDMHKEQCDTSIQVDCDPRLLQLEATCKHLTAQLQAESDKSRLLLASQHVMRKEEGQWIRPNSSKKLAKQLDRLWNELEKGVEPGRLKTIRKRVMKMKNSLEVGQGVRDSEERKGGTAGFGSLCSLSQDDESSSSSSPHLSNSQDSWPNSPHSPNFSISRIEPPARDDLTAEIKLKSDALREAESRIIEVTRENEQLKEEKLRYLKKDDELEKLKRTIEEFMTVKVTDSTKLEEEQAQLAEKWADFERQKDKFRKKRDLLREKVSLVNERQKKIQSKEKLLSEKEGILQLEEKKHAYHKQAVDQLWKENDEKRRELLKCRKVIEDEWKVLMEETKQFEALKVADRRVRGEVELEAGEREKELERQADSLEELAERLNEERDALAREKAKIHEERLALSDERSQLSKAHKSLCDKLKRYQVQQSEVTLDRLSIARQKKDVENGQRDLALMIPALQKLLTQPADL